MTDTDESLNKRLLSFGVSCEPRIAEGYGPWVAAGTPLVRLEVMSNVILLTIPEARLLGSLLHQLAADAAVEGAT